MRLRRRAAVLAAALLLPQTAACGGADAALRAGRGDAPPTRVIAYLASWSVRSKDFRIAEIPADRLTHIFYAFGGVSQDGLAVLGDPCLDAGECPGGMQPPAPGGNFGELLRLKERYPDVRVSISLGGWTGSTYFSDAAATAEARERLVRSTIEVFLLGWPGLFDGIDVDWEFPVAGGLPQNRYRPDDRENYTLLMAEYRRQLDALSARDGRRYELAIAASARPAEIAHLEVARLLESLDFINVMTYDYHAGASIAHFNAPLRATRDDPTPLLNIEATMALFLEAGAERAQLVVGVPFYGRAYGGVVDRDDGLFQNADPEQAGDWGSGGIDYRSLVARQPERHGFHRRVHPEAQVPWLYNPQTGVWISYDDPDSVRRKAEYVRDQGFGGIMFWELSGDDGSLLAAIGSGLGRARMKDEG